MMQAKDAERFITEIKRIRSRSNSVGYAYTEASDFDELCVALQIAFCPHEFEKRRAGGDPGDLDSSEIIEVCRKCGYERSE